MFDTGPAAEAYVEGVEGVEIEPAGDGPGGFDRFRISLCLGSYKTKKPRRPAGLSVLSSQALVTFDLKRVNVAFGI